MAENGISKQDLLDLENRMTQFMGQMEERLTERIRDAQTELLRGFEKFQIAQNIRMRKIEANHSNLDTSSSQRLENLEERVLEIEKKMMLGHNPPQ
jgi:hypothetical protein